MNKIGDVYKKEIPDINGVTTATVLNTKISEVENKIWDTSSLVTTNILNTKIVNLRIKFLIMLNILLLKNLLI